MNPRGAAHGKIQGIQWSRRRWILGDVITHVNQQRVRSADEVAEILESLSTNSEVTLRLIRDRTEISTQIPLTFR